MNFNYQSARGLKEEEVGHMERKNGNTAYFNFIQTKKLSSFTIAAAVDVLESYLQLL